MAESHEVYGVRAPKDTIIVTPQETPSSSTTKASTARNCCPS